jgi:DNA polymerase III sliding clamp (beta) subunit (PCNA family)
MELTIPRSELKTAVTGLSKIIPGKVTIPILGAVRFEAKNSLTATATDLDQTATFSFLNASCSEEGGFVLPLTALKELTKGADRDQIRLVNAPGNQIAITNNVAGNAIQFTVNALDPAEWPETKIDVQHSPADGFLETYRRLAPFASTDPTRYVLNSIYLDVSGTGDRPVCMVSVDGRRLSVWNSMRFDLKSSCLIPASRFLTWAGLTGTPFIGLREEITPKSGKVPEFRKAWFGLTVGAWNYTVKVPDGTFPNWRQVIPDYSLDPNLQRCCFTDKDAEALKKILPGFPGHDSDHGTIVLVGKESRLSISGRGKDAATDTVLILEGGSSYEGAGGEIGLNRTYLIEALAAGFRTFSYVAEMSPLKSVDDRGGTHVIMPVRTGRETVKIPEVKVTVAAVNETPTAIPEAVPVIEGNEVTVPLTNKENEMPEKNELSALDRLQATYETARMKVREAQATLADLAGLIKEVAKEDRQRKAEVESVRSGLAKLQAIKV